MSLWVATRSRRTAAVALQSFASGLPLGLVWYAIPDWMRDIGVDIQVVGLLTLAQAPWTFKVLWAPLVDRFSPPFWGRRRGWMALTQVVLVALGLLMAGVGGRPEAVWVVGALALAMAVASATQDIAIDAYAVELLHPEEQGAAAGARTALYRAALLVSGGVSISLAARIGWPAVNVVLATIFGAILFSSGVRPEVILERASGEGTLEFLLFANVFMLGFNMIPAFPMDGGRVLRGALASFLPYTRATRIASRAARSGPSPGRCSSTSSAVVVSKAARPGRPGVSLAGKVSFHSSQISTDIDCTAPSTIPRDMLSR